MSMATKKYDKNAIKGALSLTKPDKSDILNNKVVFSSFD
jgi:hypothetical protein